MRICMDPVWIQLLMGISFDCYMMDLDKIVIEAKENLEKHGLNRARMQLALKNSKGELIDLIIRMTEVIEDMRGAIAK